MSSEKSPGDAEKLSMLDDLVIEALLADRDDHVPDAGSSAASVAVRSSIAAAKAVVGRRRLAEAQAAVAAERARPRLVASNSEAGARALRSARAADPALDRKMTMAARNERESYEADEAGIAEDLAELEAWEENGKET